MDIPAFDESVRTGLSEIDDQHVWLFELAGRVCRMTGDCALDDNAAVDSRGNPCTPRIEDAVAEAVYGLVDYITEHFTDEQEIMRAAHYPLVGIHMSLHADLSQQVAGYVVKFMNGDGVPAEEIAIFFTDWLTMHIMHHDREFVGWLAEHAQN